jgi:hypothetical protein
VSTHLYHQDQKSKNEALRELGRQQAAELEECRLELEAARYLIMLEIIRRPLEIIKRPPGT